MKENKTEALRKFFEKWRMATVSQLHGEFGFSHGVSEDSLRVMLMRLRKARLVHSCRMGDETVFFDFSLRRRAEYIEKLSPETRTEFYKRSGIHHHVAMVSLAQRLQRLKPRLQIQGNVLSELQSATYSDHQEYFRQFAPDLTLYDLANPKSSLLYVEVERTLKSEARYKEKWFAYETDQSVSFVLYWLLDQRLLKRVQSLMKSFFQRMIGSADFEMGVILQSDFEHLGLEAPTLCLSMSGCRTERLEALLDAKVGKIEVA